MKLMILASKQIQS